MAETTATVIAMNTVTATATPAAIALSMATFGASAKAGMAAYLTGLGVMTGASMASIGAFQGIAAGGSAVPSYDEGGINTSPGFFYSGVPEAHVPLKSGAIPVEITMPESQELPPIYITVEVDGEVLGSTIYNQTKDGAQIIHERGITSI